MFCEIAPIPYPQKLLSSKGSKAAGVASNFDATLVQTTPRHSIEIGQLVSHVLHDDSVLTAM